MPVLFALLIGLVVLLLTLPDHFLPVLSRRLQRQLVKLGRPAQRAPPVGGPAPLSIFLLAARLPTGSLTRLLDSVISARYRTQVRQRILFAGLERRLTWDQFLALKVAIPLVGLVYTVVILLGAGFDFTLLFVGVIPVLGFFIPDQWIAGRVKRRQGQIERELPAVLTTLAITTEAGLYLGAAMEEVARLEKSALAGEFRWATEQVALGLPQGPALEAMAARCGVPDLTMFVSTLVQSFEKGASQISATLRSQAQEAWAKRRHRAEELAQTASVRLFLPLIFMVFPAVLIFLLGPALMTIGAFFSSSGQ